jgi:hypothetical protein
MLHAPVFVYGKRRWWRRRLQPISLLLLLFQPLVLERLPSLAPLSGQSVVPNVLVVRDLVGYGAAVVKTAVAGAVVLAAVGCVCYQTEFARLSFSTSVNFNRPKPENLRQIQLLFANFANFPYWRRRSRSAVSISFSSSR